MYILRLTSGADPGFKVRGGGGADLNFVWGISCEKSRFYAKKIIFFPILWGGGGAPPGSVPGASIQKLINIDRRKLVEILVLILKK